MVPVSRIFIRIQHLNHGYQPTAVIACTVIAMSNAYQQPSSPNHRPTGEWELEKQIRNQVGWDSRYKILQGGKSYLDGAETSVEYRV